MASPVYAVKYVKSKRALKTGGYEVNSEVVLFIVLMGVALFFHWPLVRLGLGLVDSDQAWIAMESDRFRNFEFPMYFHGLWYSGTLYGALRSLWVACIESWTGYVSAHLAFTHLFSSALISGSIFFMVRAFWGTIPAFVAALVAAMGFVAWDLRAGLDWYVAVLAIGCWLFAIRGKVDNPWTELTTRKLFIAALLSGIALYMGRSALVYLVVFWMPWTALLETIRKFLADRSEIAFWMRASIAVLLGLFAYLEIFGTDIGMWGEQSVKLHSTPNLHISALIFLSYVLREHGRDWIEDSKWRRRFGFVLAGFALGFSREIIYLFSSSRPPLTNQLWGTNSFEEAFWMLGVLPQSLMANFGSLELGTDSPRWISHFSHLLAVVALGAVFVRRWWTKGFEVAALIFLLALLGFLRTRTHLPGHPKYLFWILPAFFLGLGCVVHQALATKHLKWVLASLIGLHLIHQGVARRILVMRPDTDRQIEALNSVIHTFQQSGIELVYSDEYHQSNQFSFASAKTIGFYSSSIYPKFVDNLRAQEDRRRGVLLTTIRRNDVKFGPMPYRLDGGPARLIYLGEVDSRFLFEARVGSSP